VAWLRHEGASAETLAEGTNAWAAQDMPMVPTNMLPPDRASSSVGGCAPVSRLLDGGQFSPFVAGGGSIQTQIPDVTSAGKSSSRRSKETYRLSSGAISERNPAGKSVLDQLPDNRTFSRVSINGNEPKIEQFVHRQFALKRVCHNRFAGYDGDVAWPRSGGVDLQVETLRAGTESCPQTGINKQDRDRKRTLACISGRRRQRMVEAVEVANGAPIAGRTRHDRLGGRMVDHSGLDGITWRTLP
jgi:hypothetical protein